MSIPIIVSYGGQWNDCNVYENYLVFRILIDMRVSLYSLVALTCEQIELDESVELYVLLDFGKSNVQTVVSINKDNDVAWYLAFAKDATSRHPLVAHVSVNCLGTSSSSSSVGENVDTSLNIDDFRFMSTDRSISKEIVHKARTNLGVNISYQKAWRTKEHMVKILHDDTVESYALIQRFFDKLVESNPGTCTALEMNDSGHFKFCFMAFGASIERWKYCRPIISVDGTFLKYSENDVTWTWFFEKIRGSTISLAVLMPTLLKNLSTT
ncbi:protein FAR1-RELATED SEQUENCE 4-like [Cucumis melo var. makuwa]|uniref:Protein FAR1-RELATED SEQUENCE 4-like n=1 Tax=Cucumis melo var. makuwa TaxID=1194695 RepID=A0A5A7U5C2_CUCMM|nr:protein FAR1-RELATED SEQUENCE 4-like [Cucumis melo var. makuwa]